MGLDGAVVFGPCFGGSFTCAGKGRRGGVSGRVGVEAAVGVGSIRSPTVGALGRGAPVETGGVAAATGTWAAPGCGGPWRIGERTWAAGGLQEKALNAAAKARAGQGLRPAGIGNSIRPGGVSRDPLKAEVPLCGLTCRGVSRPSGI